MLALRIYERGALHDIGLSWHPAALRHFGIGFLLGGGAALGVIAVLIVALGTYASHRFLAARAAQVEMKG